MEVVRDLSAKGEKERIAGKSHRSGGVLAFTGGEKRMKINVNSIARKVEVDNRIPLRYYYRIADNLLKQASVYREEKNLVDLYIMLLRFSSLVSETIPYHRDYQIVLPKERILYKKKLLNILDELESIKPEVDRRVKEHNEAHSGAQLLQLDGSERTSYGSQASLGWHSENIKLSSINVKQAAYQPTSTASQSSWTYNNDYSWVPENSMQIDKQFQKLSIKLPQPNKETLSRHSFLGPNGLRGQWRGPSAEIKVQYPSSTDLAPTDIPIDSGLNQAGKYDIVAVEEDNSGGIQSTMDAVLSLDDGRWLPPAEDSCPPLINEAREDVFQLGNIHQPCPPPVLARIQQDHAPIPPSKVADPRPGPAKPSPDGMPNSNSYQHLHVPVRLMEDFLRLARANTEKNLETCAVLAGSLKNRVFHITTLIVPKQESTSDSIMLPEAVAIVMAPTDSSCPHGIFHLSDPGGVSVVRNCQQRGFHPHEEPSDGTSIYEHCSHVFMNANIKFDVIDLR
ncbi:hypothetical protein TIFTF001_024335 [Ficus carica]|uniref:USP8 dimerisation domain-containing protein n=1 Tax=Ficus carica TaxID=3494 RepID=A0AA88AHU1_FICCA|nr:hypothetical protein TIFTF001_024335 [Ficus carica]